jgi:prepilin-type N-terminal cleavage/methylation domain-containing protein
LISPSENIPSPASAHPERGFTVTEMLVVTAIIVILVVAAVFALGSHKRAYRSEDAAAKIVNFCRDAHQRALAQRQTMMLRIDRDNEIISITDENTLASGDEQEVRRDALVDRSEVRMDQPALAGTVINPPAAPYNYPTAFAAGSDGGVWVARFRSDGSVVDAAGTPLSVTLFFWPRGTQDRDATLIRSVTVFGPSGSIRYWRYDGSQFTAEVH